jgi:glycerol-3-phosphate dehydrogenase
MSQPEKYDLVVLGSGESGKFIAWSLGSQGKRSAVVERLSFAKTSSSFSFTVVSGFSVR